MTCMCVGSIIGGGIFGSLCLAVNYTGAGIFVAFIIAYILSITSTIPGLLPSSITPAANGYYTILCRVLNPYFGVLEFANLITLCVLNVALASTFTEYFVALVPINPIFVTCAVIIIVSALSLHGYSLGSKVQNVMTGILVLALLMFVILGLSHVSSDHLTLKAAITPKFRSSTSAFAAIALLMNCLDGGDAAMILSDKIDNPRRGVLKTYFLSTSIVTVLYFLMSIIVVGVAPNASNLSEVALCYMNKTQFSVFIIFGALFGIITTINCITLTAAVRLDALSRDLVLPAVFSRKNKNNQPYVGLIIITAASLAIAIFNIPIGTLFSVLSALSLFTMAIQLLPILKLHKLYPHSWAHSPFKMPIWAVYTMIVIAFCFCMYQAYALVVETNTGVWLALLVVLLVFYTYFFIRKAYLAKKKNIDLIEIMRQPLSEWLEKENYFKQLDEQIGDVRN